MDIFLYIPGLGVGMLLVSGMACVYFNVILTWTIYYLIHSFTQSLPWSDCGHSWNTPLCLMRGDPGNETDLTNLTAAGMNRSLDVTWYDGHRMASEANTSVSRSMHWMSPAEEFWQSVKYSILSILLYISDIIVNQDIIILLLYSL